MPIRTRKAIRLYQKLVELKPSWAEGWWYRTLYYDSDQHAAAINPFHRVLVLEPKNAEGYAMLGLRTGLNSMSHRSSISLKPALWDSVETKNWRGWCAITQGVLLTLDDSLRRRWIF